MTAKEFYINVVGASPIGYTEEVMINFARYHVEQALTEVSKVARWEKNVTMEGPDISMIKGSILNAYPPEKIK